MLFRLAVAILWVACAENSKVRLDQNVGNDEAIRVVDAPEPLLVTIMTTLL